MALTTVRILASSGVSILGGRPRLRFRAGGFVSGFVLSDFSSVGLVGSSFSEEATEGSVLEVRRRVRGRVEGRVGVPFVPFSAYSSSPSSSSAAASSPSSSSSSSSELESLSSSSEETSPEAD